MKNKIVFKTVLLTLGVILILAISAFGIASLLAPAAMMDFTSDMGLVSISGDYAYREYERSGDLSCLARSFVISADEQEDRTALNRFNRLYEDEKFSVFCDAMDEDLEIRDELSGYRSRGYLCGLAAQVRYRLAKEDEEREEVLAFALSETDLSFPQGNPVILLIQAAAKNGDKAFLGRILETLESTGFDEESPYLQNFKDILEEITQ